MSGLKPVPFRPAIDISSQPATMDDFFKEAKKKIKFTSEPGGGERDLP
ncbi:hypothetical protein KIF59_20960 [Enterobacter cloacae subsp. cloacae]|nr:hypothetical protein [Enterobacter cloacae subsp. cloacae]